MNAIEMLTKFISDSKRIFVVSRKPTMDEYKKMALIIAIGIVIIGVLGFLIQLIFTLTGF
jgi:protein transport protein SEC61 subunit gamma-like protein